MIFQDEDEDDESSMLEIPPLRCPVLFVHIDVTGSRLCVAGLTDLLLLEGGKEYCNKRE